MISLTLAEQFLLLALDDESGKLLPMPDRAFDYALAGALLADLARIGRLRVEDDGIHIEPGEALGSPAEDTALKDLSGGKVSSLRGALSHLAGDAHGLRKQVIEQLVDKGILREEEQEIFWIFHFSRYPLADPSSEQAVRQRLKRCLGVPEAYMSESDHLLLALLHVCRMESLVLDDPEAGAFRDAMAHITEHDRIGSAVAGCLEEIHKALIEIRTYSGM